MNQLRQSNNSLGFYWSGSIPGYWAVKKLTYWPESVLGDTGLAARKILEILRDADILDNIQSLIEPVAD